MKQISKIAFMAIVITITATIVFVACKKEETNIDKVANEQVVKHQKTEGDYIDIPEVFYSSDGITFYDGNGTAVTGIHVDYGEKYGHAQFSSEGKIASCTRPGNDCGDATIWDDETTMSWSAVYAVRDDGTIITQPRVYN